MNISTIILFHENSDMEIISCLTSVEIAANQVSLEMNLILGFTSSEPSQKIKNYLKNRKVDYLLFGKNVFHSYGINELVKLSQAKYCFILNPDVVVAPDLFKEFVNLETRLDSKTAAVECRQLPFDHPKIYDEKSKEVTWFSGACVFIRRKAFKLVDGFDFSIFPMYCNDVDISLRLRNLGFKLYFEPELRVFHSKQIDENGKIFRSQFEKVESENSYLLMHVKYHQLNYPIQTRLNQKLAQGLDRDFITRLKLIRNRKKFKVSKELISEFFVKGDFSQRRFK
jgi:GT2 family glycosyltransferase